MFPFLNSFRKVFKQFELFDHLQLTLELSQLPISKYPDTSLGSIKVNRFKSLPAGTIPFKIIVGFRLNLLDCLLLRSSGIDIRFCCNSKLNQFKDNLSEQSLVRKAKTHPTVYSPEFFETFPFQTCQTLQNASNRGGSPPLIPEQRSHDFKRILQRFQVSCSEIPCRPSSKHRLTQYFISLKCLDICLSRRRKIAVESERLSNTDQPVFRIP